MPRGDPTTQERLPKSFISKVKEFQRSKQISTFYKAMRLYDEKTWKQSMVKRNDTIEAKAKNEYDKRLMAATRKFDNQIQNKEDSIKNLQKDIEKMPSLELELKKAKDRIIELENNPAEQRLKILEGKLATVESQTEQYVELKQKWNFIKSMVDGIVFKVEPCKEEFDGEVIHKNVPICLNPLRMRKEHPFVCYECDRRNPDKHKACDEIVTELKTSPVAYMEFTQSCHDRSMNKLSNDSFKVALENVKKQEILNN